tara:strand:+ start:5193 stop:5384 length:192 start_codon:yes stop_codon:yes gene_type:complete
MTSEVLYKKNFSRVIFCVLSVFFLLGTVTIAKETVSSPAVELSEVKEKKKSASDDDDDNEEGC